MAEAVWVPIAASAIAAGVGAGAGALLTPKPSMGGGQKPVTPDSGAADARRSREFRQRRGAAANELTGRGGAEAPSPGPKRLLGE